MDKIRRNIRFATTKKKKPAGIRQGSIYIFGYYFKPKYHRDKRVVGSDNTIGIFVIPLVYCSRLHYLMY